MSLLLDALKKAAQEKLEKQSESNAHPVADTDTEAAAVEQTAFDPASDVSGDKTQFDSKQVMIPERETSLDIPQGHAGSYGNSNRTEMDFGLDDADSQPEAMENEALSIDLTDYSADIQTEYGREHSDTLANQLSAFDRSGYTDHGEAAEIGRMNSNQKENTYSGMDPVSLTSNMGMQHAAYSGSPNNAALVFANKAPEKEGNTRLYFLIGLTSVMAMVVGGMFAYDYLAGVNDSSILQQPVVRSPAQSLSSIAAAKNEPGENIDSELLIEQEDYASVIGDDLSDNSLTQPPIAATATNQAQAGSKPAPVKAIAAYTDRSPAARKPSYAPGDYSISKNRETESLQSVLMQGYNAYNRGEYEQAEAAYNRALNRAPGSRDALLGMAAVEIMQGNEAAAARYYKKLLERDPKDALAITALSELTGNDNTAAAQAITPAKPLAESQIKLLLREQPDSHYLYFSLGNIYAGARRWAEAQQAYFDAYRLQPGNPDYAFNLAVSLDHLGKSAVALQFYREALTLTKNKTPNFDLQVASSRISQLQTP